MSSTEPVEFQSEEQTPAPPKRRRRRWLRALVWLCVLLLILVGIGISLAPTVVSSMRAGVVGSINESLNAELAIEATQFAWTSEQKVEKLSIGPPPGFPPEENVVELEGLTVKNSLWNLVFGSDPVEVEVSRPVARLHKRKDGTFNFEEIVKRSETGSGPQPPAPQPSPPTSEEKKVELKTPRPIVLRVTGGRIDYVDDELGTSSRIDGIETSFEVKDANATAKFAAALSAGGGAPGTLTADILVRELVVGAPLEALQLEAKGAAKGVDLRPLAALIEKLANVTPPDRPIDGEFSVRTENGVVHAESTLDAGYIGWKGIEFDLPVKPSSEKGLAVKIPYHADLGALTSAVGALRDALPTTSVAGDFHGTVVVEGPTSLDAILADAEAALAGLAIDVDLALDGGRIEHTLAEAPADAAEEGDSPAAETQTEEPPAPKKPIVIDEPSLTGRVEIRLGASPREIEIPKLTLAGKHIQLDATGSAAAEGEANRVKLAGSAGLVVPAGIEETGIVPANVSVKPGTRATLSGLVLDTVLGGEKPIVEATTLSSRLEVEGGVRSYGISIGDIESALAADRGRFVVTNAKAAINGGELAAKEVSLDTTTPKTGFKVDASLARVAANYEMTPLLSFILPMLSLDGEGAALGGFLDGALQLEGQGFELADLTSALKGSGALNIGDATISGSKLFTELAALLKADLSSVRLEQLGSEFSIGSGKIDAGKLFVQSKEGGSIQGLALRGATWLDGRIDYAVELSAVESAIGDKKARAIFSQARKVLGMETLPLRLQGSLTAPKLAFDAKLDKLDLRGALESAIGEAVPKLRLPGAENDASKDGDKKSGGVLGPDGVKGVLDGILGGDKE